MKVTLEPGDPLEESVRYALSRLNLKQLTFKHAKVTIEDDDIPKTLEFAEILVNTQKQSVKLSGQKVKLTRKEYGLLTLLMLSAEMPVYKAKMLRKVWGIEAKIKTRTVDTHILTLRSKLGSANRYIQTVPKIGYMLTKEVV
jgi:DNA-binding response OmpR family regulator